MPDIGQELLDLPFPEMLKRLALGVAQAQLELDMKSTQIAQLMAGQPVVIPGPDGTDETIEPALVRFGKWSDNTPAEFSLMELGFTPSFYQFVDTIIEVKMSISVSTETEQSRSRTDVSVEAKASVGFFSAKASMRASTVSASFSQKYSYHAEGSSLMRTKLVPVPPPAILEERIRMLMEGDGKYPTKPS